MTIIIVQRMTPRWPEYGGLNCAMRICWPNEPLNAALRMAKKQRIKAEEMEKIAKVKKTK